MELLGPSEKRVYDRLSALNEPRRRGLIAAADKIASRRKFFYKRRDNHPVGLVPLVLTHAQVPTLKALTRSIFRFQMKAPALYHANYRGFAEHVRLERRTQAWFDRAPREPKPWELLKSVTTLLPSNSTL